MSYSLVFDPETNQYGFKMDGARMKSVIYSAYCTVIEPLFSFLGNLLMGILKLLVRRPLYTTVFVLVFVALPNIVCSYSYSPCLLRTQTESFTRMETKGIGALVNVSEHSFTRAAELITASGVVDDLRVMTNGRVPKAQAKLFDDTLERYRNALKETSRALVHVEASVWTLVEM